MLKDIMLAGSRSMGIAMTDRQAEQFAAYHDRLTEANARMNLTRVPEDLREAADRNYLDSIAALAHDFPPAEIAVDVGSGAGFPGIPLSIMLPQTHFTLMDALAKRVAFLQSVIDALHLNARAVHLRAEDAARMPEYRERFDLAVARAVAPMNVLCELTLPFVKVGGHMLAMKGPGLDAEMREAENALLTLGGEAERVIGLPISGRDWDHRAAWIVKAAPTPDKYPRRAGMPEKRPLV